MDGIYKAFRIGLIITCLMDGFCKAFRIGLIMRKNTKICLIVT